MLNADLFSVAPSTLAPVRAASHAAVQWPSRAARANLPALADDSHSNLGWHEANRALVSHPLDAAGTVQLGFSFASAALLLLVAGEIREQLPVAGVNETEIGNWCDERLAAAQLQVTGRVEMPYELPAVDYAVLSAAQVELNCLGAWFALAHQALTQLVHTGAAFAVTQPLVRCWPHHYDLATLFMLEHGDPETARSVGVGLSPGDGSYGQPYFYCTPWPAPAELPEAAAGFRWHTEGFTSLVLPAADITAESDVGALLAEAFSAAKDLQPGRNP